MINRFFFPTSMGSQFRYNLQMLFHMHHMYLRILERALDRPLDYWRLCDAQIQYYMVHLQIRGDVYDTGSTVKRVKTTGYITGASFPSPGAWHLRSSRCFSMSVTGSGRRSREGLCGSISIIRTIS